MNHHGADGRVVDMPDSYVMGHSPVEAERLRRQGEIFADDSSHLLRRAGLEPGMRVLEVGCGPGDLTLLAAEIVGPGGSVVAVDEDPGVLATARERVAEAGHTTVEIRTASVPEISLDAPVDAVIGRFVLLHLSDPVAAVRALSTLVRPGGLITFQDVVSSAARAAPPVPLFDLTVARLLAALRASGTDPDTGLRLRRILSDAGLPRPRVASCQPGSGDPDSPVFAIVSAAMTGLLPVVVGHGIATREEIDPDTLADRLRAETVDRGAVLYLNQLVAAWSRLPG